MASTPFHRYSHGHQDLVLSLAYNYYGTRLATASSDHRVKIWDLQPSTAEWSVTEVFRAHDAEVTEVKWTGPYTGEHLGSIGEDGLLRLWRENLHETKNSGRRFVKVFELRSSTVAPFMGLDFKVLGTETFLACMTRDGFLTVSEPEDETDLSGWRVLWADYLGKTPARTEETGFRVSWHKERLPAWPAVLAGLDRKALSLAVSVGEVVRVFRTDGDRKFYNAAVLEGARGLVRDVSWAGGSMRGFDTIATAAKDGFIRIYELHTPGAAGLSTAAQAFPPAVGGEGQAQQLQNRPARSGIGAGLAEGPKGRRDEAGSVPGAVKQEPKLVAELEAHDGSPWRVSWSHMGDLLVSTGDDGIVKVWRKSVEGKWLEAADIDAVTHA